jgi:plastocyanin
VFLFIISFQVYAQINEPVPSRIVYNDVLYSDKLKESALNQRIYDAIKVKKTLEAQAVPGVITLPVVIHVVHNGGVENISNEQILNAMTQINEGFRNRGVFDPSTGVDMEIEFCLSRQTPNGMSSDGVTRTQSVLTDVTMENDDRALKGLVQWDPENYINIWIVRSINSTAMGSGINGYATMPINHGSPVDGIVLEADEFGINNHHSKIAIHELAHYLGLYHTFEGGCQNNDCLLDGDKIADTPPDNTAEYTTCNAVVNSCNTDENDTSVYNPFRPVSLGGLGDQNDLSDNFMDYANVVCMNSFTQGQKERARATVEVARGSLLESIGCVSVCPTPINASFNYSPATIYVGNTISFANTSTPTSGLAYEWYVNGVFYSNAPNPTYVCHTDGELTVQLIIRYGTASACVDQVTRRINVLCTVRAGYEANAYSVPPGTTISFRNTSSGIGNFTWSVNNVTISNALHFNYTFPNAGFYDVALTTVNGQCQSRYETRIEVCNCSQIDKRTHNWYFGIGAGATFNTGVCTSLAGSPVNSYEACATISDENGNLLFSAAPDINLNNTDEACLIKTSTHQIMPNGSNIKGIANATQMIIVPHPGNPNQYYVFTTLNDGRGGLYYSIVDMSLNNGLGDVTIKNVQLYTPVTEKVAAVHHANGQDFWVVSHGWNNGSFYSYLINQTGIAATPVISTVGTPITTPVTGAGGVLKISPTGNKAAMAALYHIGSFVELYDFNNVTGVFSNPITLPDFYFAYGIEFSPDGTKLYTNSGIGTDITRKGINQFTITSNNLNDIVRSKYQVFGYTTYGALQLGPDGRIYIALDGARFVGAIQKPNLAGSLCAFDLENIALPERIYSAKGLPNFVASYLDQNPIKIRGPLTVCPNAANITYDLSKYLQSGTTVTWSASGSASIVNQNNRSATVTFGPSGSAQLSIQVQRTCGVSTDVFPVQIATPRVNLGPDKRICPYQYVTLDAGSGYVAYRWQDGSTNQTFRTSQLGVYTVVVTAPGGCTSTDNIEVLPQPEASSVNIGPDRTVCPGNIVVLDAGEGYRSYLWQDGTTNRAYTAYLPTGSAPGFVGTYSVTVTDMCGSSHTSDVNIAFTGPIANAGPDQTICPSEAVVLHGTGSGGTFRWLDAAGNTLGTTADITVSPTVNSIYTFRVEGPNCMTSDQVSITVRTDCNNCTVNAGPDRTSRPGQQVVLQAVTNGKCTPDRCSRGTPPANNSGCTKILSGWNYAEVYQGQVACIPAGTEYYGTVNIYGGTVIVYGTARNSGMWLTSGKIIVVGNAYLQTLPVGGKLENYGNIVVDYDMTIKASGELVNYGTIQIRSNYYVDGKATNYSSMTVNNNASINGSATLTNECEMTIGNIFYVNNVLTNKGVIQVNNTCYFNGASQYNAVDGSLLGVKNVYFDNKVYGGNYGYSSVKVSQHTQINQTANIQGKLDICDSFGGIENRSGTVGSSVTFDCRAIQDNGKTVASFVWTDQTGKVVGTGKTLTAYPTTATMYTITVLDALGNTATDQVLISMSN